MLCILQNSHSQSIFTIFTGSPAITGSFWTVTDCEPAWSQLKVWRYALNIAFTGCFQKVVRNWQTRHETQWYKWHLWTSNSCCTLWNYCTIYSIVQALTYNIHTALAVSGISWASWGVHFPRPSAVEGSLPHWYMGKLLLRKEKREPGVAEAL